MSHDPTTEGSAWDVAAGFWKGNIRDIVDEEHLPLEFMGFLCAFLPAMPGRMGTKINEARLAEQDDCMSGPHRVATARHLFPIRRMAARNHLDTLDDGERTWVLGIIDVLNFHYCGRHAKVGPKQLSGPQRQMLQMIAESVHAFVLGQKTIPKFDQVLEDLGRVRFDYASQ